MANKDTKVELITFNCSIWLIVVDEIWLKAYNYRYKMHWDCYFIGIDKVGFLRIVFSFWII